MQAVHHGAQKSSNINPSLTLLFPVNKIDIDKCALCHSPINLLGKDM